jgi:hypothetical protein
MWGLDSIGPFKTASGGYGHILVTIDKFTWWIEVRPVTKVTSEEAAKFIQELHIASVFPIESSPTSGRPLQGLPYRIFARTT